jgi:subtilisin family serine protease
MRRALLAAVVVALAAAAPAAAFVPTDPLAAKQWYLQEDHAFDAWAEPPTALTPVKVALVDSGIDCSLPDFQGRILDARSFVGGDPCTDTEGHGTFVAGEIAANLDTQGIVGIAYTSQLLIAKVVRPDGTIPLPAEAAAIRWAADSGARVINLSLGGVRDPVHTDRDTYSALEAQAVAYAYGKGAVVVAAVGNADEAFSQPWPYASYPAALPHVIGVSALTRSGNVPDYSNRDPIYNDISAPGSGILSTFPLALTATRPTCPDQGFSDCGGPDYADGEGTSFSAPQVSAAAAVLFGLNPALTSSQVTTILERQADDVTPSTGCPSCLVGRDKFSGWGSLDVQKAVAAVSPGAALPPSDAFEPNDSVAQAHLLRGSRPVVGATLDYWDDVVDVYRVKLARGQRLLARVRARPSVNLIIRDSSKTPVARTTSPGQKEHLSYGVRRTGWYYVEVRIASPGAGRYTLHLEETS